MWGDSRMKVMIDIPKEFEEDLKDNFQEFFNRIVADITYSLNDEEPMCCGNYERETAEMFLSAFEKSTVIPDDATNVEVIKTMFPNAWNSSYIDSDNKCTLYIDDDNELEVDVDWMNAPYKKEVE